MAKKAGAKPKYNYKSEEFLNEIESFAKKGMTDKEIALSIGLSPEEFSRKKASVPQLYQALMRARAQINSIVRQKYLALGLGGIKTKTVTRRKIELSDGEMMDADVVHETETELPPNPNVLATWLFNHDEEWRQKTIDGKKLDITTNGKDIAPQNVKIDIAYNDIKDLELQEKSVTLKQEDKDKSEE